MQPITSANVYFQVQESRDRSMEDLFQADQIQGLSCGGSCSGGILSGRGSLGGMYSGTDLGGIDTDSSI